MVDAQGQDGLGLHVHSALIEARFDEHRGQSGCGVLAFALDHLHRDGLALRLAQL
ncbi:hypothetical protein D3C85_1911340 [compost metagenome]